MLKIRIITIIKKLTNKIHFIKFIVFRNYYLNTFWNFIKKTYSVNVQINNSILIFLKRNLMINNKLISKHKNCVIYAKIYNILNKFRKIRRWKQKLKQYNWWIIILE